MDKLLIVDDNENNLFTFSQILEEPDREVICVSSGKDALAAMEENQFSLVLLDVQMPDMDGFEAAKMINAKNPDSTVPIIFISAVYKTEAFISQGFDLGAFDYLTKPVDAYLLQNKVRVFLKLTRQEKELKTLNRQLEANNQDLEDRIRKRTREIWIKHREMEDMVASLKKQEKEVLNTRERLKAQDRLATLGVMAAGVAHELKNPLNFILNFSNIIHDLVEELGEWKQEYETKATGQSRTFDEIVEDLTTSVQMIHQQGVRADNTIKSILKSAHVQTEIPAYSDINQLLDEAIQLASYGSDSLNIEIETRYSENLPKLFVASASLVRVFLNLAVNSFYALGKKKKRLGDPFEPKLTLVTSVEDKWLVVQLHDNGDGIPKENLTRIFEAFFTTKPPGEGTGLGLYLSRNIIVKDHCGQFDVISEEGQGVQFIIKLPLEKPEQPIAEEDPSSDSCE